MFYCETEIVLISPSIVRIASTFFSRLHSSRVISFSISSWVSRNKIFIVIIDTEWMIKSNAHTHSHPQAMRSTQNFNSSTISRHWKWWRNEWNVSSVFASLVSPSDFRRFFVVRIHAYFYIYFRRRCHNIALCLPHTNDGTDSIFERLLNDGKMFQVRFVSTVSSRDTICSISKSQMMSSCIYDE